MAITPIPWTLLPGPNGTDPFLLENTDVSGSYPLWIMVCPSWRSITHLQITAEGTWSQTNNTIGDCSPDGLPEVTSIPKEKLALEDCPPGALIGKFAGSSVALGPATPAATNPAPAVAEGKAFAIGSYCVVPNPANCIGPLFVGFNGLIRPIHVVRLSVTVKGAPSGS